MHLLHAPALPNEFRRKPVQQFRISRRRPGLTKVPERLDYSRSKMMLPNAVYHHACRQWMFRIGHPLGESRDVDPFSAHRAKVHARCMAKPLL